MKTLRAFYRFVFFILFVSALITRILWSSLWRGADMRRFLSLRQRWTRRYLLPVLGVRLRVQGSPPDFPCLVLGNHRSYLDPVLLCRDVLGFPVSKAEVANWPVVGHGARLSGVLYLKRESVKSRKATLDAIAEKVQEGYPVILFPEGTTHAEAQTYPFRKGAFQLAATHNLPIALFALDYRHKADYWIGTDSFVPHFFRRFGERQLDACLHYGPVLQGDNAETLIEQAQQWVDRELGMIRREFLDE